MILGVVLAGGQSRRFGSDKALALLDGQTLLERAYSQLKQICDDVVIAGKELAGAHAIADRPSPGMGPLGGVAGGLHHAEKHRFTDVLTMGVDSIGLPGDIIDRLHPAPAYLSSQPVVGRFPVSAKAELDRMLAGDGRHSMLAFAEAIGARAVQLEVKPANINTPEDLAAAEKRHDI